MHWKMRKDLVEYKYKRIITALSSLAYLFKRRKMSSKKMSINF